jgi:general secretion pathway protein K
MTARRQQRGSILLVVLFLVGLLGAFSVVAATVMNAGADASRSFADSLRADEVMHGAIDYIVAGSGVNIQQAHGAALVEIGGSRVAIAVRDEAARIDLNHAPAPLLAGIFRQVGASPDAARLYAARILDWRDADDDIDPNGGAERGAYRAAGRIDGPRNGPFLHVAELALVLGIPQRFAAAVAPYVTVASGSDKINPLYADPPVLLSIPGVSEDRVRDFLDQRQRPGATFEALTARLGPVQDFVTDENGRAVSFEGRVQLGPGNERRYEAIVSVVDGGTEPYRILAWDMNPPERVRALP